MATGSIQLRKYAPLRYLFFLARDLLQIGSCRLVLDDDFLGLITGGPCGHDAITLIRNLEIVRSETLSPPTCNW